MSIQTFLCKKCGHEFEKLIRGGDDPERAQCPQCEHTAEQIPSRISPFIWGKSGGWN